MIAAAMCVVGYWSLYYLQPEQVRLSTSPEYIAFESAFILPDAALSGCLLIGGILWLRASLFAFAIEAIAAGLLLFLALIDISFCMQRGLYFPLTSNSLVELGVNAACLIYGAFLAMDSTFCIAAYARWRQSTESSRPVVISVDGKTIEQGIKAAYSSTYLTLMSIVQGALFAVLVDRAGRLLEAQQPFEPHHWVVLWRLLLMLLVVAGVWHDYFMGCTAYNAILVFADVLFPFSLGVAQYYCIVVTNGDGIDWLLGLTAFWAVGALAYIHKWRRVLRFSHNQYLLALLTPFFFWNITVCIGGLIAFAVCWKLSHVVDETTMTLIVTLFLFAYVVKAAYLWRRTLEAIGAEDTAVY